MQGRYGRRDYTYLEEKFYVAFVDFRAAFDTIDKGLLLEKLWRKGIREKMYDMIKDYLLIMIIS